MRRQLSQLGSPPLPSPPRHYAPVFMHRLHHAQRCHAKHHAPPPLSRKIHTVTHAGMQDIRTMTALPCTPSTMHIATMHTPCAYLELGVEVQLGNDVTHAGHGERLGGGSGVFAATAVFAARWGVLHRQGCCMRASCICCPSSVTCMPCMAKGISV